MLDTKIDKKRRFITKKWIKIYDQSGSANDWYKPNKQTRFKTSMLRSDLRDYSDAYITVTDPNNANYDKKLAFKDNTPFTNCISKMNNLLIDYAQDLDIVMPMYNLIEYSKNYKKNNRNFLEFLQRWTK